MIKDKIKTDLMTSRKGGSSNNNEIIFLSTILGEIDRIGKDPSDDDIIKIVKKTIEGINQTTKNVQEITYLEQFLPKMMTSKEIYEVVQNIRIQTSDNFMLIMREFQKVYKGKADNNLVKQIIQEMLENGKT